VHWNATSGPQHRGFTACSARQPDPPCADQAPIADGLTPYDYEHLITYLRLLDADADGADWQGVARIVLHIDPVRERGRAGRSWGSHLARARWMTEHGYRHLLREARPGDD
jgi:Uncharacterized conserved protein (DUF2285)